MISIDDWSNLVTVNYDGGLSGDFFATLLDNAIVAEDHLIRFNNYDDKNRYLFMHKDAFAGEFKCLHYFYTNIQSMDLNDPFSKQLHNLYIKLFNSDKHITSNNIRTYCFEKYHNKFDRIKVLSTHFIDQNSPSLQYIFPKSKNTYVGTNNNNYKLISKFIFYYKTGNEFFKIDSDGKVLVDGVNRHYKSLEQSIQKLLNIDYNENYHNEFFIDIYDLLFNTVNYDRQLSTYLKHHIILDAKQIEKYKNNTINLLKNFDIDVYHNYKYDELYFKISNIILKLLERK